MTSSIDDNLCEKDGLYGRYGDNSRDMKCRCRRGGGIDSRLRCLCLAIVVAEALEAEFGFLFAIAELFGVALARRADAADTKSF